MNASSRNSMGLAAVEHNAAAATETTKQFITFTLDAQEYGVDIMRVREIKGWTEPTALPQSPAYVRGVINLRGIIVPILDLRARFGMGATTTTRMHVVIIVITDTRTTGLLVDAVSDIISVEPGSVRPVPQMDLPTEESFLEGLVALDDRMVTLVSLDGLIGSVDTHGTSIRPH
jgi:purine-binding chemotaxis protein CheW